MKVFNPPASNLSAHLAAAYMKSWRRKRGIRNMVEIYKYGISLLKAAWRR